MGGTDRGRGHLTSPEDRQTIKQLVDEAVAAGCRKAVACQALGITSRTLERWQHQGHDDGRKTRLQKPKNKLSDQERAHILQVINSPEFKNLSPCQVVPILAERGVFLASEATIYRILREEKMLTHRLASKPARHKAPDPYHATGPNEVWTWDITYLPTTIRGKFFYLYMICDLYSRKVVGWEVHDRENSDLSAEVVQKAYLAEDLRTKTLVLHSDNGAPMKGATMLATLQRLGIMPSFSRPSVSNDNPFSEALFRTLKYRPEYPDKPFDDVESAREWVSGFVTWYNEAHRHSALKFVTPQQRHTGEDQAILARREQTYLRARRRHPERWAGKVRDWTPSAGTSLNAPRRGREQRAAKAVA